MTRKQALSLKLILLVSLFFFLLFIGFRAFRFLPFGEHWGFPVGGWSWSSAGFDSDYVGPTQSFDGVERIVVDTASLPIRVLEGDVDQVTVQDNSQYWGLGTGEENTLTLGDGTLTFRQSRRIAPFSRMWGDVVVQVPRGSLLTYDLSSSSGSLYMEADSSGELLMASTSGSVKALGRGESLSARSISGSVTVEGAFDSVSATSTSGSVKVLEGGRTLFAKSTSGSVRVDAPFEELTVESTSGSLRAVASPTTRSVSCKSISGSVRIRLEGELPGYTFTYSSTSGSVRDEYRNERYEHSGSARYGDGSISIGASTTSGSIRLENWD